MTYLQYPTHEHIHMLDYFELPVFGFRTYTACMCLEVEPFAPPRPDGDVIWTACSEKDTDIFLRHW
jgi:hypothetical protein